MTSLLTRVSALVLSTTLLFAIGGCAAVAEIAYDTVAERDLRACNQIVDASNHRACVERVRAIEAQAQKARSGK